MTGKELYNHLKERNMENYEMFFVIMIDNKTHVPLSILNTKKIHSETSEKTASIELERKTFSSGRGMTGKELYKYLKEGNNNNENYEIKLGININNTWFECAIGKIYIPFDWEKTIIEPKF